MCTVSQSCLMYGHSHRPGRGYEVTPLVWCRCPEFCLCMEVVICFTQSVGLARGTQRTVCCRVPLLLPCLLCCSCTV